MHVQSKPKVVARVPPPSGKSVHHHVDSPSLKWERRRIMTPLQRLDHTGTGLFSKLMWSLGQFCSGEVLVTYFVSLYLVADRYRCLYGIYLVPLTEIINGLMKWHFRVPRPGWVDRSIDLRAWSHEYSFPSSHAQIMTAVVTFFLLNSRGRFRRSLFPRWGDSRLVRSLFLAAPIAFAGSVCVSRVYEGIHYPRDVAVGAVLGSASAFLYNTFFNALAGYLRKQPAWKMVLLLELVPLLCFLALRRGYSIVTQRTDPASWKETATSHPRNKDKTLLSHDVPYSSYLGMVGVLAGLGVAAPFVDKFPLRPARTWTQALARLLVGNSALFSVFLGIRALEKSRLVQLRGSVALVGLLRFMRYGSIAPVTFSAPLLFRALSLL